MTDNENKTETDDILASFFTAAKADNVVPSEDLMAAIMRDAVEIQPQAPIVKTRRPTRQTWWQGALEALGGWQAAGALTACAAVGVWIGFAAPEGLSDLPEAFLTQTGIVDSTDYYFPMADITSES